MHVIMVVKSILMIRVFRLFYFCSNSGEQGSMTPLDVLDSPLNGAPPWSEAKERIIEYSTGPANSVNFSYEGKTAVQGILLM